RIRHLVREIERGTRINDRGHDIAFGNESRNCTEVGQSRLARERTGAFAAVLQRAVDFQALSFDLYRQRLPHVSGAHQADILNYHFSRAARSVARVANGRPPKSKLAEAALAS